ncbi:MAG: 2Fe-2S iron-sulfur cluster binding domain-containing protein [Hyphomicrobiales bacterium]|jgi:2Fe-2S ferredoxin|nr:MAG: 2Fe-2S iron-sulfur cluster binding domain-containing protein [Hyphomicrobiales bacterium]
MTQVNVTTIDGERLQIAAGPGMTLMELLRDAGVDDEIGMCGGCCSCASCHIYLESPADGFPAAEDEEDDLLDTLESRTDRSRLACQLEITSSMSVVHVAMAQRDA